MARPSAPVLALVAVLVTVLASCTRGAPNTSPGNVSLELTSLWHRETAIRGCYAYTRADFDTAIDIVRRFDLGQLVSATYPLDDYADAIAHAASAGRRGAVKIAFDLRKK